MLDRGTRILSVQITQVTPYALERIYWTGLCCQRRFRPTRIKQENERLASIIEAKGIEIRTLRADMEAKDKTVMTVFSEIEEAKKKISPIISENKRLNETVQEKEKALKNLSQKLLELNNDIHEVKVSVKESEVLTPPNRKERDSLVNDSNTPKSVNDKEEDVETQVEAFKKIIEAKGVTKESIDLIRSGEIEAKKKLRALQVENKTLMEIMEANGLVSKTAEIDVNSVEEQFEGNIGLTKLKKENDRLSTLLEEKDVEVKMLKKAIELKDKAIEDFRTSMVEADEAERQKIEELESDNQRLTELLEGKAREGDITKLTDGIEITQYEIPTIKEENNKLRHLLDEKQLEVENLLGELEDKEKTIEGFEGFEAGIQELENMIEMLVAENNRLKGLLNEKMAESKRLREERNKVKKELAKATQKPEMEYTSPVTKKAEQNLLTELEELEGDRELGIKSREILNTKLRVGNGRKQLEATIREELQKEMDKLVAEKEDAEEKISRLNTEIERIQGHLNRVLSELQDERKRFSEFEVLRAKEIDRLRQQYENMEKDEGNGEAPIYFDVERKAYETQIEQLQATIGDFEKDNSMLIDEIKELRKISAQRLREVEEQKKQVKEVEERYKVEMIEVKQQIGMIKLNRQEVDQISTKHKSERATDQIKIKKLQDTIENYRTEVQTLHVLLEEKKNNFFELSEQYNNLKAMYDTIKEDAKGDTIESLQRLEKLDLLEREVLELEKSKNDYKKRADRNSSELTKKNKELVDSIQELGVARQKYEEVMMSYQAINYENMSERDDSKR